MSGFLTTLLAIMAAVQLGSASPQSRKHPGQDSAQRSMMDNFARQPDFMLKRDLNDEELVPVSEETIVPSYYEKTGNQQDKTKLLNHLYNITWSSNLREIEPPNVRVQFGLSVVSIRFDNATGIATTTVWERMMWTDSRLAWSPEEFGGVDTIRWSPYNNWIPDMTLYNSVKSQSERSRSNVVLYFDGTILWIPQNVYETYCDVDASATIPEVKCQYKVASWTYDSNMVGLDLFVSDDDQTKNQQIHIADFDHNCGATIIETSAKIETMKYPCCPEPYSHYEGSLTFVPRGWGY